MPVLRVNIAHVGYGGAGEIEGPAVTSDQGLHHIGVVHLLGPQAINRRQHLRQRPGPLEFGGHRIDHPGIKEGLIPLHIHHQGLLGGGAGEGHQCFDHRGNPIAAGAAGGAGQHGSTAPETGRLHQLRSVGAEDHCLRAAGLETGLQHPLQHRFAGNVGQNLAWEPGGSKPSRNRHDRAHRSQSQSRLTSSRAENHSAAKGPPIVRWPRNQGPPRVQCNRGESAAAAASCTSTRWFQPPWMAPIS